MATLPEDKESNTFSVIIDDWDNIQNEFLSPVYRANGYPWRLRVFAGPPRASGHRIFSLIIICDKSSEAELWKCTAIIKVTCSAYRGGVMYHEHTFKSWDETSHEMRLLNAVNLPEEHKIQFEFTTKENGNSWRLFPVVNFGIHDCIIVCGERKKKFLATQSPFFDRLFFGDFKEKNMSEIPIGDVEGEEFFNVIMLLYRYGGAYLSDRNVRRILQLADRFELKFVEDKAVSYLLSSPTMPIHKKILISIVYNLLFLIENLGQYGSVRKVFEYQEFDLISKEMLQVLIKKIFRTDRDSYETMLVKKKNREEHPEQNGFVTTISISNDPWEPNQTEQRLRVYESPDFSGDRILSLICDKSSESELWQCTANLTLPATRSFKYYDQKVTQTFNSWFFTEMVLGYSGIPDGSNIQIEIALKGDGASWRLRPILDPLEPLDGILVIGDLKKTLRVNKKSLASQSPFFDKLFFGDFEDKNNSEFPIEDVECDEFANIIKLIYRHDEASLTGENVERMLELAIRFEIQIVVDRVTSYLLSFSHPLPIHKVLIISDHFNLPFLLDTIVKDYLGYEQMQQMIKSPEFEQLSIETLRILFKKFCR